MPLYFSRPLHRVDYVAAKFAALATSVFVLMVLPLTILFVGALLAEMPVRDQVPGYLRSLAGAALLALVLAGIGLVIASLTPRRGLGVAAIIAVFAVLSAVGAAVAGTAIAEEADTVAGYAGLISPFTLVHGVQSAVLGAPSALEEGPPGTVGAAVFLATTLALIVGSFGALLLRYRKVSI
jgi:ABC-2 type transport system permease protein